MAVIVSRQKMTVRHSEGEHTIFPSREPQSLPDALVDHDYVQGAVKSGWITIVPVEFESAPEPSSKPEAPVKRKRN